MVNVRQRQKQACNLVWLSHLLKSLNSFQSVGGFQWYPYSIGKPEISSVLSAELQILQSDTWTHSSFILLWFEVQLTTAIGFGLYTDMYFWERNVKFIYIHMLHKFDSVPWSIIRGVKAFVHSDSKERYMLKTIFKVEWHSVEYISLLTASNPTHVLYVRSTLLSGSTPSSSESQPHSHEWYFFYINMDTLVLQNRLEF